jgi:lipopolysaccharide/colanic/teichoic acid biosynthesis glycosyltransferase
VLFTTRTETHNVTLPAELMLQLFTNFKIQKKKITQEACQMEHVLWTFPNFRCRHVVFVVVAIIIIIIMVVLVVFVVIVITVSCHRPLLPSGSILQ